MFDCKVSTHKFYDDACRKFALTHNMEDVAQQACMRAQTLRNKLNPDQPHQLTVQEVLVLTDLTEDATFIDGLLAQIQCLPCAPVNEVANDKLPLYVMNATAEVCQLRSKNGRVEREMFAKLRTAKYIKAQATSNEAVIEFTGRVQRMVRVHHYGLRDRPLQNFPYVKYEARALLGLNYDDIKFIESYIIESLKR